MNFSTTLIFLPRRKYSLSIITMSDRGNGSYLGRKQQVILQGMKSATKFWSKNESIIQGYSVALKSLDSQTQKEK